MVGAFGTVALIACLPILAISILGVIYRVISQYQIAKEKPKTKKSVEIIEFDYGDDD